MNPEFQHALSLLPHGAEFRFVDQLVRLDRGKSGAAEYRIPCDAPFLRGHFPGAPIFPGVLLIEAAAQLAGVVAQSDPVLPPLPGLKLTAIRGAKILGTATPGQIIVLESEVIGRMATLIQARASVKCEEKIILQLELTLSGDPASK